MCEWVGGCVRACVPPPPPTTTHPPPHTHIHPRPSQTATGATRRPRGARWLRGRAPATSPSRASCPRRAASSSSPLARCAGVGGWVGGECGWVGVVCGGRVGGGGVASSSSPLARCARAKRRALLGGAVRRQGGSRQARLRPPPPPPHLHHTHHTRTHPPTLCPTQSAPPGARIVYMDGAFDLFHVGHVKVLQVRGSMRAGGHACMQALGRAPMGCMRWCGAVGCDGGARRAAAREGGASPGGRAGAAAAALRGVWRDGWVGGRRQGPGARPGPRRPLVGAPYPPPPHTHTRMRALHLGRRRPRRTATFCWLGCTATRRWGSGGGRTSPSWRCTSALSACWHASTWTR